MDSKTRVKKAPVSVNASLVPKDDLEEQVRKRAYEIFEERGMVGGYDLDDWLQAEQEMKASQQLPDSDWAKWDRVTSPRPAKVSNYVLDSLLGI